jgi:hydrogenase maturation factor
MCCATRRAVVWRRRLNEIAQQSGVGMMLQEKALPVNPAVAAACEFLGLDPLYVANEGKLVAICAESDAEIAIGCDAGASAGHPSCNHR